MTKRYNLLFDLDDTLIHCNKYFDMVIDQFAELLAGWFSAHRIGKDEIKRKQSEIDLAGIQINGFLPERFPASLVETYEYFSRQCGRLPDGEEKERLSALGFSVYECDFELYPSVIETLTVLRDEGHSLSLYTGGDPSIQRKKVEKVNLSPFFNDRIFVAQHKNSDALENILRHTAFDRSATWMIGNSLRTDILPAIECDIGAVYIPPLSNWAFDLVEVSVGDAERLLRLKSIHQVPGALKRLD